MVTLLNHLDRERFELHLAVVTKEGPYLAEVPEDVTLHDLACDRVRAAWRPILGLVWRVRPDTILSTMGHLNIALIALRPFMPGKIRLLVREASIVTESLKGQVRLWRFLYKTFYQRADLVICQSVAMMEDLQQNFSIDPAKMVQIYNPVDMDRIRHKADETANPFDDSIGPNLVAIGRLSQVKGFDRLIESFPLLLQTKPHAQLWFLGQGEIEQELKQLRDRLGLQEQIHFVGFQKNPYAWMRNADLFVLSSYFEGLPNVLLEAIALECPVLAVEHPGGTREIMKLTEQQDRLLPRLEWKDEWFVRPRGQAMELLRKRFGLQTIIRQYSDLLLDGNQTLSGRVEQG